VESETAAPAPLPEAEEGRVRALERYGILDTPREKAFDELALLATRVCEAPLARISFLHGARRWTKAAVGPFGRDIAREAALCARAIRQNDVLVVADTRGETGPGAGEAEAFRFYAGAPLVTPDGFAIGTLCVLDSRPRKLSEDQRSSLRVLAAQVVAQLELRRYRRQEAETSGEKLLLEVAGLTDREAPEKERSDE
jgi:GAF domain-containing protein